MHKQRCNFSLGKYRSVHSCGTSFALVQGLQKILKSGLVPDQILYSHRFPKALYRQALALEGLQQRQNALEVMILAQKQLPQDVQASSVASTTFVQHVIWLSHTHVVTLFMLMLCSFSDQCALQLQIREAVGRLSKAVSAANKQPAPAASNQEGAKPIKTEAPEGVHLKKRITLQEGWLYQPSADGVDENLLILLHGYGDTPGNLRFQCCCQFR